jgi:hypothetical protein
MCKQVSVSLPYRGDSREGELRSRSQARERIRRKPQGKLIREEDPASRLGLRPSQCENYFGKRWQSEVMAATVTP